MRIPLLPETAFFPTPAYLSRISPLPSFDSLKPSLPLQTHVRFQFRRSSIRQHTHGLFQLPPSVQRICRDPQSGRRHELLRGDVRARHDSNPFLDAPDSTRRWKHNGDGFKCSAVVHETQKGKQGMINWLIFKALY